MGGGGRDKGSTRSITDLSLPAASQRLMSSAAACCSAAVALNIAKPCMNSLYVERPDGEMGAGLRDRPSGSCRPRGAKRHGAVEIRIAQRLPPDVDAVA